MSIPPLHSLRKWLLGALTSVVTNEPIVGLTFDDGPNPVSTPRLLSILNRYGARATFFMLGNAAAQDPELVRGVAEAGHAIGNHSWDHRPFPLISGRERRHQIRSCQRALGRWGERLFRPPFGYQSVASALDTRRLGYQIVTWNVVGRDWLDHDAKWVSGKLIRELRPGCIILLHDGPRHSDRQTTLEAVRILLERTRRDYHFVTIPEMLRKGKPQLSPWEVPANPSFVNQWQRSDGEGERYDVTPR